MTNGLVKPSGNEKSTNSGNNPLVVNKFIIDTRIDVLYIPSKCFLSLISETLIELQTRDITG